MENTLNSRKRGKYYHRRQKITFYFSDVCNKAQKLDNSAQFVKVIGHT